MNNMVWMEYKCSDWGEIIFRNANIIGFMILSFKKG